MGFEPYKQSLDLWKRLPDRNMDGKKFFPLQKGSGTSFKSIPPMQGVIERAKIKLRRQVKNTNTKKKNQSKVGKRGVRTSKAKPKRKSKTSKRTSKSKVKRKPIKRKK